MADWRALYPFESRYADREGLRLHYVDEGRGEPVVFVHGNPTWSFLFRELIADARSSRRALALDHIGMGLSDKPDDSRYEHRLASRVRDFGAWLDGLGLGGRVTLAAHDWGGAIALAWAAENPGRVARLALFNTAAFLPRSGKALPAALWLARTPLGAPLVQGANLFVRGLARYGAVRPLPASVRRGYAAPYASWAQRRAVLRFVQDIPRRPGDASYELLRATGERLGRLEKIPAAIFWGLRDFVFDAEFLAEWRKRLPQAEVHAFAEAGHLVIEDAAGEVRRRFGRFLEGPAAR